MKDKHGRQSKPFFPLKQMKICFMCGLGFFPSKRHKYMCKNCSDAIARREIKNG